MLSKAYEDSVAVTKAAKDEAFQILTRAKQEAERNTERQVAQLKIKTDQLLEETNEAIRREAKEKTRKETETLLAKAREEAARISDRTVQSAKEEAFLLVSNAKRMPPVCQNNS